MEKKNYFIIEESAYNPGKYRITLNHELMGDMYTEGSYGLLPARLLNLSYVQYCRMCRDLFNAELRGKNKLYINILFPDKLRPRELVKVLNAQMNLIEFKKSHPLDTEKQKKFEKTMAEINKM